MSGLRSRGGAAVAGVLALLVIASAAAAPAQAAPRPGRTCPKAGVTVSTPRGELVCTKVRGRLVWRPVREQPAPAAAALASLPVPATASLGVVGSTMGAGRSVVAFGYDTGPRGVGAIGTGTRNPQPTFFAPLGTPVLAPVTGLVTKVELLYSGDYTIWMAASPDAADVWETEHVIGARVAPGDTVVAGQVIATVSDYDSRNTPGVGLVELGLLRTGSPPVHVCPFADIAPGRRTVITVELTALFAADAARGLPTEGMSPLGCVGTDPIAG